MSQDFAELGPEAINVINVSVIYNIIKLAYLWE